MTSYAERDRQAEDADASNSAIAPAHLGARRDHYLEGKQDKTYWALVADGQSFEGSSI